MPDSMRHHRRSTVRAVHHLRMSLKACSAFVKTSLILCYKDENQILSNKITLPSSWVDAAMSTPGSSIGCAVVRVSVRVVHLVEPSPGGAVVSGSSGFSTSGFCIDTVSVRFVAALVGEVVVVVITVLTI